VRPKVRNTTRGWARFGVAVAPPFALVVAIACRGPSVPTPPTRGHAPLVSEATCVPFPPPPPKVEIVGARPSDRHVWLDGAWSWRMRRWVWRPGGWAIAPDRSFFTPWQLVRLPNGALAFHPAHWHRDDDRLDDVDAAAATICPDPPPHPQPIDLTLGEDATIVIDTHTSDAPESTESPESSESIESEPRPLIAPPD
jgi:hypothetical protein